MWHFLLHAFSAYCHKKIMLHIFVPFHGIKARDIKITCERVDTHQKEDMNCNRH